MSDTGEIRMDAGTLNAFLHRAFPEVDPAQMPQVLEVEAGRTLLKLPYASRQLRPGGVISGPTMMSLADTAAYAMILARIGEVDPLLVGRAHIVYERGEKSGQVLSTPGI